jgi:hypothetical protein
MNVIPQSPPIRVEVSGPLASEAIGDPHGDGMWHIKGRIVGWRHNAEDDELTPYIWGDGENGAVAHSDPVEIFVLDEP